MPVTPGFRAYALEQMGRVAPVTARSMFGGVGVYAGGLFFALLDDDVLYFKTSPATRVRYEAAGMPPFRPYGPDGAPMGYHQVPPELLESPELLRPWMEEACEVARAAKGRR